MAGRGRVEGGGALQEGGGVPGGGGDVLLCKSLWGERTSLRRAKSRENGA